MNKKLLLLFLHCLPAYLFSTETVVFDMILFGDKIGSMTVTREEKPDGIEYYTLETRSKAKFLWVDHNNFTRYEVTYKNGVLISSNHSESDNGKVQRWTKVDRRGDTYFVDGYKGKKTFTEAPFYSIVTVYFKNIANVNRIFYEPEGDFSTLKKSSEAETWEFKSSDGNKNVYHFKNGKIHSMDFHVSVVTVKAVRVK